MLISQQKKNYGYFKGMGYLYSGYFDSPNQVNFDGEEVSDTQNGFSMLRTTDQTVKTGNCAGTEKKYPLYRYEW